MGSWGWVVVMADSLSWLSHGCQDWRMPHVWYFCWVPLPNDMCIHISHIDLKKKLQNHHPKNFTSDTHFTTFPCIRFHLFSAVFYPLCFGPRPSWTSLATSLSRWFTGGNGLGGFSFLFSHLIGKEGVDLWLTWLFFFSHFWYLKHDKTYRMMYTYIYIYIDIRYASIYSRLWLF